MGAQRTLLAHLECSSELEHRVSSILNMSNVHNFPLEEGKLSQSAVELAGIPGVALWK